MADVCDRITALELNDQHMTRIERHIAALLDPDNSRPLSQHQQSSSAWSKVNILNIQRNRSKSNEKRNRSVSFSSALRTPPFSTAHNKPPSLSQQEASEILSLLKALQQDMADVRDHITALELNDQRMTRIERHIGL
ncbi:hypothetical protein RCL_jg24787.t1 [Rhizophagus clarus]|uniref:Uncharacterized protein n=1 Tax=Rhizophagus clarus TaxID=94130 RepID=A0A8H3MEL5_9GLOM|nr:hypothetical protein RCL_jg24787.t1 [Rhizophagus clarus]